MSASAAYLAREIIMADAHLRDAVRSLAWSEAQSWQDTRERLADERYVALRQELQERHDGLAA